MSPYQPGAKGVPAAARHDDCKAEVIQQEDSERNPERNRVDATELDSIVDCTRGEECRENEGRQESLVAKKGEMTCKVCNRAGHKRPCHCQ